MILYRLKNWKYTLDIYQSKMVIRPHWYFKIATFGAKKERSICYTELVKTEVKDPFYFYPGKLDFSLKCKSNVSFTFIDEAKFYKRLKLYIDKQRSTDPEPNTNYTSRLAA